jgi:hypothetical protein
MSEENRNASASADPAAHSGISLKDVPTGNNMEPDDDDLFVGNPMTISREGSPRPDTPDRKSVDRTSSPDISERVMRNSRYSVDGVIDPKKLMGYDEDTLVIVGEEALDDSFDRTLPIAPQMYTWNHIGLYAHYAAIGLNGGIQGIATNFCFYYYKGDQNVCANSASMIFIAWGFKVFYAMVTDSYRPFGMRRKPYMMLGWSLVLLITFIQAFASNSMNATTWLGLSIVVQFCLMIADVPADGYSVELGQIEKEDERGQVLATGQRIRFFVGIGAGLLQALLVNGRETNKADCKIAFDSCWAWGLTPNGYYGLTFCVIFLLCIPIYYLEEPSSKNSPLHSFKHHKELLWDTMTNPTTLYLLIFVIGNGAFSGMAPIVQTYTQFSLIGLTNFQSGIMTMLTNLATMSGIICFQKFFINWNWRYTQYISLGFSANLGLLWLLVYYDVGGVMTPWFTVFLQLNVALTQGLSQVLFAMAVIELAKKGQESTTYEMIVSTANSSSLIGVIISTQLLSAIGIETCGTEVSTCPKGKVDLQSKDAFIASNGPNQFANYTFLIYGINIIAIIIFTQFLPNQKKQCAEWKQQGNTFVDSANPIVAFFTSTRVGYASVFLASIVIAYNVTASGILLDPDTSCLQAFGGNGCT